jgi:hypothetical protein
MYIKKIEACREEYKMYQISLFSMDISTKIAKKYIYQGSHDDLVKKSHVYTFYDDCFTNVRNYIIPFSRGITWTQFRFVYTGSHMLHISLMLRDFTDKPPITLHTIGYVSHREWHTIPWIIPSSVSNQSSLYFQVSGFEKGEHVRFDVLGFEGIREYGKSYAFIGSDEEVVFIVNDGEYTYTNGSINLVREDTQRIYMEL